MIEISLQPGPGVVNHRAEVVDFLLDSTKTDKTLAGETGNFC